MSVLTRVRAATHSIHKSLDDHPLLVRFTQDGKADAYRGFLEAFRSVVALELHHAKEFLDPADNDVLEYREWRESLDHDLLVMEPFHHDTYLPNISSLVPAILNRSEFWGFLYVLEGSVLGGREVAKTLDKEWPAEFLLRGSQNRLRWPFFMRRLLELENAGIILADGVEKGAVKTFEAMIAMFDEYELGNRESYFYDHNPSPQ